MDCINVGGQRALLGAKGLALVVDLAPLGDKGLALAGRQRVETSKFLDTCNQYTKMRVITAGNSWQPYQGAPQA